MNDSKNFIIAIVLSALVLLGWSWAADRYFPTAKPAPAAQDRRAGKRRRPHRDSRRRSQSPRPPPRPRRCATARAVLGSTPRVRDRHASRSRARSTSRARSSTIWCCSRQRQRPRPRIRRRCGCCRRSARRTPMSPSFGWAGHGAHGARPRHRVDRGQHRAHARPAR